MLRMLPSNKAQIFGNTLTQLASLSQQLVLLAAEVERIRETLVILDQPELPMEAEEGGRLKVDGGRKNGR